MQLPIHMNKHMDMNTHTPPPPPHTHTCTHTRTYTHARTHTHTHIRMHARTHTHACTHTHIHTNTHAHTQTCMTHTHALWVKEACYSEGGTYQWLWVQPWSHLMSPCPHCSGCHAESTEKPNDDLYNFSANSNGQQNPKINWKVQ